MNRSARAATKMGMNGPSSLAILLLLAAASGCELPQSSGVSSSRIGVIDLTFTQPNTCRATFGGKTYVLPDDERAFVAALKGQASKFESVRMDGDYNAVPYKCVGSAIFLAQSAGIKRVNFIAQPPAASSNR